ncbi:1,4-beta-D-glucan glucohydrolase [Duganella sp. FT50W]|uniref:1,4-beta-D-glucan glucohydrolase n=1 Tax=Duganella lactea TaxID=2692173 RepID=A0A6L8MK70_9BURK|nr:GDSL-type esterase/lipase family protein [Duganella lactea]MYM82226.1 1,4-beta-D-glucan glucohydrolase [Duganella lactea]
MPIRLAAILAVWSSVAFAAAPQALHVYDGKPPAAGRIQVSDVEAPKTLDGDVVEIAGQAKAPDSVVTLSKSGKSRGDDALTLRFRQARQATLSVQSGQPVDLRPYLAEGVLAFDVNVQALSAGGIAFKLRCGDDCERSVPYLVPGRELAGKGWRHLVFSLRCFYRDGDDFSAVTRPFAVDGSGSGQVSIANVTYQMRGAPNASCPDYKTVAVTPDKLNESWSINWWTKRHEDKLAEARQLGKNAQIVFIGDSITHAWEKEGLPVWRRVYQPLGALDQGFSGDRTENVLWRLLHGEVDGLDPKVAVLMFGTNNTGHRQEDPRTTAAGIQRNIDELRKRLPHTRILLLAIFPRGEKPDDKLRRINEQVNAIIAGFADERTVFFANINQAFLQADGTLSTDIMPDLLHPNERGYEIWAEAMAPALKKLLSAADR